LTQISSPSSILQNGFQDTFTTTAQAALEFGAMPWARGLIANEFDHYILDDGMVRYRGEELPQSARMLTIMALYWSYNKHDTAFLLQHFERAKAVAEFLTMRRSLTLGYPRDDPRYGLLPGDDEADNYNRLYFHQKPSLHFFASTAEFYRACMELGAVWQSIGKAVSRPDVATAGAELLKLAPLLYHDLHTSLNRVVNITASPGDRCYPHRVEWNDEDAAGQMGAEYRSFPEMFFSGALTEQQTDDMYKSGQGLTTCPIGWWMSMGAPSAGVNIFNHVPFGFPHGLLQHDMVERFLLYFFTISAHGSSRGFWMTPESSSIVERTHNVWFSAAGPNNVPLCLKWMLVFEEPETRTLWLGKATPRDWLVAGEAPLAVERATTRYGRISFFIAVVSPAADVASYRVKANITLPPSCATAGSQPAGGLVLRIRAPTEHAGKLSGVTVGGKAWRGFNASTETVSFSAAELTASLIATGLPSIVATFAAVMAAPLKWAPVDISRRQLPRPVDSPPTSNTHVEPPKESTPVVPNCPSGTTLVESFTLNGTAWHACEDLQAPGGALVLMSARGDSEWFTKGYEPYGTNATDDTEYFLGLGRDAVASADSDVLGQRLLVGGAGEPSWQAVERAVPAIRKSGATRGGWWMQTSDCDGVRTFVGSRGASNDVTFSDLAQDCTYAGLPSSGAYAQAMHNKAVGDGPQLWNESAMADGMIGEFLPSVIFYYPVYRPDVTNCTPAMESAFCNFTATPQEPMCQILGCGRRSGTSPAALCAQCKSCDSVLTQFCRTWMLGPTKQSECSSCVAGMVKPEPEEHHRYWTYVSIPIPDMHGNREQGTWMRFQQVACAGSDMGPPCKMVGWPMYWKSLWFSRFPSSTPAAEASNITGGANVSTRSPAGFYANLLELRRWWDAELAAEGMMELALPSPASTNGTYLNMQAMHSIVRSMITRANKWHPRYGTTPG
jgi:hypothetical protein